MKKLFVVTILFFVCGLAHSQSAVSCVQKYVTYNNVTQGEFDAAVDFTFNVGCGNFRKSTLLKKWNAGDIAGAANEFGKWIYDSQKHPLAGLVRRRAQEKDMFLSLGSATPIPAPCSK